MMPHLQTAMSRLRYSLHRLRYSLHSKYRLIYYYIQSWIVKKLPIILCKLGTHLAKPNIACAREPCATAECDHCYNLILFIINLILSDLLKVSKMLKIIWNAQKSGFRRCKKMHLLHIHASLCIYYECSGIFWCSLDQYLPSKCFSSRLGSYCTLTLDTPHIINI